LRHLVGYNFVLWLAQGLEYSRHYKYSFGAQRAKCRLDMLKRGGTCVTMFKLPKKINSLASTPVTPNRGF